MVRFIIQRTLISIVVLFGISILLFVLVHNTPGDPLDLYFNPALYEGDREAAKAELARRLGLDQPLVVQYFRWLLEALQGNLGYSLSSGRAVSTLMFARLQNTLALLVPALLVSLIVGVVGGVWAAFRQNKLADYALSAVSVGALSVPPFFLALVGIFIFGLQLRWLPTAGMNAATPTVIDGLRHLVMPALILGATGAASFQRWTRSSMLDVLSQDYMLTARSKGLSSMRITWRHAVHNALIPIITIVAMTIPTMLGGAVIIEQVFSWPGMGRLALEAIHGRDYPVLMGFVMFIAIIVVLANLVADVLYSVVDPRIRL